MTVDPAVARAAAAASGSRRTSLFAATVTGGLVTVGSIARTQPVSGSVRREGNR
jgi:hypothetical protein